MSCAENWCKPISYGYSPHTISTLDRRFPNLHGFFSNIRTIFTINSFIAPILPTTGNCIGPIYHYYHQCYCNLLSLLYLFYFVYSYYYVTGYCYDYSTSIITTNFNATVITNTINATVITKHYQYNRYH